MFCGEHRLPENHACPKVGGPLQPGYAQVKRTRSTTNEKLGLPYVRSNRSRFRFRYAGLFSKTERKHILLATGAMLLLGLSLTTTIVLAQPILLLLLIPAFIGSFLGHELSHKFLAQRNGLWAEFRTNMYGLMLTFVSIILPFKFLAPGQTNIQGSANKEVIGAIGLIGPGVNVVLGAAFFVLSKFASSFLSLSFLELTIFNGWLAVFNLIPFGSFDGTSVYQWDKTRWVISLVAAAFLLVLGFYPNLI